MASISTNKTSGLRRVIVQVDDTRKSISIGQMRMKTATYLRDLCQDLADCAALGKSLDPDLAEKVRKLSPDIHEQLARIGRLYLDTHYCPAPLTAAKVRSRVEKLRELDRACREGGGE